MDYAAAVAAVTAPGSPFETEPLDVGGQQVTAFKHAPRTLRALVQSTAARGDTTFLVYEDERWSFAHFHAEVAALATALIERHGVATGDRVAVAMRNYPEWVVSFAAITSIGAVSVSFNAWWTEEEVDYALGDCDPKVLIADVERVERARSSRSRWRARASRSRG